MGVFTQPTLKCRRAGIALPVAIFSLVIVGFLVTGAYAISTMDARASLNREDSVKAQMIAEAGLAHALGVIRNNLRDTTLNRFLAGSDNVLRTADDGYLSGYGLQVNDVITAAGRIIAGGTYFVQLIDDPADNDGNPLVDSNSRILARCRGVTTSGASASIEVVLGNEQVPAIATDGNLTISGNPDIVGACGGAHANNVTVVNGTPTVQTQVSATDTVRVSGRIENVDGSASAPVSNAPRIEIPDYNPQDYCPDADYVLRADGFILRRSDNSLHNARSSDVFGWKRSSTSPVEWDMSGNVGTPGTFCVEGNAKVSGNPGPVAMSIIATGSIEISGNPLLTAEHADGILLMAGGDVKVSGNPSGGGNNYEGLIYAESQCEISGNPAISGQIMCKDKPNLAGTRNITDETKINGNPTIRYDCGGMGAGKRRVLSWYQRLS